MGHVIRRHMGKGLAVLLSICLLITYNPVASLAYAADTAGRVVSNNAYSGGQTTATITTTQEMQAEITYAAGANAASNSNLKLAGLAEQYKLTASATGNVGGEEGSLGFAWSYATADDTGAATSEYVQVTNENAPGAIQGESGEILSMHNIAVSATQLIAGRDNLIDGHYSIKVEAQDLVTHASASATFHMLVSDSASEYGALTLTDEATGITVAGNLIYMKAPGTSLSVSNVGEDMREALEALYQNEDKTMAAYITKDIQLTASKTPYYGELRISVPVPEIDPDVTSVVVVGKASDGTTMNKTVNVTRPSAGGSGGAGAEDAVPTVTFDTTITGSFAIAYVPIVRYTIETAIEPTEPANIAHFNVDSKVVKQGDSVTFTLIRDNAEYDVQSVKLVPKEGEGAGIGGASDIPVVEYNASTGICSFKATGSVTDLVLTATLALRPPEKKWYTFESSASGPGSISVTYTDAEGNTAVPQDGKYEEDTKVTVAATVNADAEGASVESAVLVVKNADGSEASRTDLCETDPTGPWNITLKGNSQLTVTFAEGQAPTKVINTIQTTAIPAAGGTISAPASIDKDSGGAGVGKGYATITPNAGYAIADGGVKVIRVLQSGEEENATADCVLTMNGNVGTLAIPFNAAVKTYKVEVTFQLQPVTEYFSVGVNVVGGLGTVSANVADLSHVKSGTNVTLTLKPNAGYTLQSDGVLVDGTACALTQTGSAGNTYAANLGSIAKNTSVAVTFTSVVKPERQQRMIVASSGAGGTISPDGNVSLYVDEGKKFNFYANSGYVIAYVKVNGATLLADPLNVDSDALYKGDVQGAYTFGAGSDASSQTIHVAFEKKAGSSGSTVQTYTVSATAGVGGRVSAAQTVEAGKQASITAYPSSGYTVAGISGALPTTTTENADGSVTYTFNNVASDINAQVTFNAKPVTPGESQYHNIYMNITGTPTDGTGSPTATFTPASSDGYVTVKGGDGGAPTKLTITPASGYKVYGVTINGAAAETTTSNTGAVSLNVPVLMADCYVVANVKSANGTPTGTGGNPLEETTDPETGKPGLKDPITGETVPTDDNGNPVDKETGEKLPTNGDGDVVTDTTDPNYGVNDKGEQEVSNPDNPAAVVPGSNGENIAVIPNTAPDDKPGGVVGGKNAATGEDASGAFLVEDDGNGGVKYVPVVTDKDGNVVDGSGNVIYEKQPDGTYKKMGTADDDPAKLPTDENGNVQTDTKDPNYGVNGETGEQVVPNPDNPAAVVPGAGGANIAVKPDKGTDDKPGDVVGGTNAATGEDSGGAFIVEDDGEGGIKYVPVSTDEDGNVLDNNGNVVYEKQPDGTYDKVGDGAPAKLPTDTNGNVQTDPTNPNYGVNSETGEQEVVNPVKPTPVDSDNKAFIPQTDTSKKLDDGTTVTVAESKDGSQIPVIQKTEGGNYYPTITDKDGNVLDTNGNVALKPVKDAGGNITGYEDVRKPDSTTGKLPEIATLPVGDGNKVHTDTSDPNYGVNNKGEQVLPNPDNPAAIGNSNQAFIPQLPADENGIVVGKDKDGNAIPMVETPDKPGYYVPAVTDSDGNVLDGNGNVVYTPVTDGGGNTVGYKPAAGTSGGTPSTLPAGPSGSIQTSTNNPEYGVNGETGEQVVPNPDNPAAVVPGEGGENIAVLPNASANDKPGDIISGTNAATGENSNSAFVAEDDGEGDIKYVPVATDKNGNVLDDSGNVVYEKQEDGTYNKVGSGKPAKLPAGTDKNVQTDTSRPVYGVDGNSKSPTYGQQIVANPDYPAAVTDGKIAVYPVADGTEPVGSIVPGNSADGTSTNVKFKVSKNEAGETVYIPVAIDAAPEYIDDLGNKVGNDDKDAMPVVLGPDGNYHAMTADKLYGVAQDCTQVYTNPDNPAIVDASSKVLFPTDNYKNVQNYVGEIQNGANLHDTNVAKSNGAFKDSSTSENAKAGQPVQVITSSVGTWVNVIPLGPDGHYHPDESDELFGVEKSGDSYTQVLRVEYSTGTNDDSLGSVEPPNWVTKGRSAVYVVKPAAGYQLEDAWLDDNLSVDTNVKYEVRASRTLGAVAGSDKAGVANGGRASNSVMKYATTKNGVTEITIPQATKSSLLSTRYTKATNPTDNPNTPPIVKHHITASVNGAHGNVAPSGMVEIADGASLTFSFMPESSNYTVADVVVDGASVGAPASYTFTDVKADHTLVVSFKAKGIVGGYNPATRTVKTLQSLAQTGDLNAPALLLLSAIACGALGVAILSNGRNAGRRKAAPVRRSL
ncbi:hypothetical protein [Adlercreutzia sp. ZJ154]|uniref:InlB B-repeat-containing protein n=1 Tax=Adlercreutzia sp. ZJ154 TaxID=2709790 RepID=UPI0013EAA798|nr:hypothetical protein [Adlercreutzia sp. ZJ154]